jgi:hypothetical protein
MPSIGLPRHFAANSCCRILLSIASDTCLPSILGRTGEKYTWENYSLTNRQKTITLAAIVDLQLDGCDLR